MPKVVLLFFLLIHSAFANVEKALVLLKTDKPTAIKLLEFEFDNQENPQKRAEISYLISLDPSLETQKSMVYYVKNTLHGYKNLKEADHQRLYRYLAELSFKQGDLKTALKYYEMVLAKPEYIQGMEDYLTLQKAWVLINLNRYSEAIKDLADFLKSDTGKLQDVISHDLGKFIGESLNKKEINNEQKLAIKKLSKNIELKSEDFFSGLITGFNRGADSENKRKDFEQFVVDSGFYDTFYAYAIIHNKFQKKSPCDFLDWKLPTKLTPIIANLMVKKSFHCDHRQKDVKKLAYFVANYPTLELALLQEKLGQSNVCAIVLNLLTNETENLPHILRIAGRHCHNEKFQKSYLEKWQALSIEKKQSVKDTPEAMYLSAVTAFEAKEDHLGKVLLPLKDKLSFFGPSQKRNLLVFAFAAKDLTLAGKWLKESPELLYHSRIFPLAIKNAKELGPVHNDPILVFLSQDMTSNKVDFSAKDLKRVKKHLSKEVYHNLDLYREVTVLKWEATRMNTLEAQDRFFFKTKRILNQIEKHKWLNIDLKERFVATFKGTLKNGSRTLLRHPTEISKTLRGVLEKWEASL